MIERGKFLRRIHHRQRAQFDGVITKKFPHDIWLSRVKLTAMKRKPLTVRERSNYHRVEDVVGCKWSAGVIAAIAADVRRPGELERYIPGISTKVLNERLRKLLAFGLVTRTEFPGLPARVEYELTVTGRKLARILDQLNDLNDQHAAGPVTS